MFTVKLKCVGKAAPNIASLHICLNIQEKLRRIPNFTGSDFPPYLAIFYQFATRSLLNVCVGYCSNVGGMMLISVPIPTKDYYLWHDSRMEINAFFLKCRSQLLSLFTGISVSLVLGNKCWRFDALKSFGTKFTAVVVQSHGRGSSVFVEYYCFCFDWNGICCISILL